MHTKLRNQETRKDKQALHEQREQDVEGQALRNAEQRLQMKTNVKQTMEAKKNKAQEDAYKQKQLKME